MKNSNKSKMKTWKKIVIGLIAVPVVLAAVVGVGYLYADNKADIKDGYMYFEPTNGMYNMINTHVHRINNDKRKMNKDPKIKNSELYQVQMKYMELVNEIMNILNGKKGTLRSLCSGRYNYSIRSVIRQDSSLRAISTI